MFPSYEEQDGACAAAACEECTGGGHAGVLVRFKLDLMPIVTDGRWTQVLRDHEGWYVTFLTADSTFRATHVLSNSGTYKLAYQTVVLTTAPAPVLPAPVPRDN
ncbi:hypothetical protein DXG01_014684 [Tephrocybe rancida]|nr:hypothetical protein DXG01_014684 [Tephrocybe rancida]